MLCLGPIACCDREGSDTEHHVRPRARPHLPGGERAATSLPRRACYAPFQRVKAPLTEPTLHPPPFPPAGPVEEDAPAPPPSAHTRPPAVEQDARSGRRPAHTRPPSLPPASWTCGARRSWRAPSRARARAGSRAKASSPAGRRSRCRHVLFLRRTWVLGLGGRGRHHALEGLCAAGACGLRRGVHLMQACTHYCTRFARMRQSPCKGEQVNLNTDSCTFTHTF